MSEKSFRRVLGRIRMKRPCPGIFLLTEPLSGYGLFEIYDWNELLQPYYRKQRRKLKVYGVASTRRHAEQLVCDILNNRKRKCG